LATEIAQPLSSQTKTAGSRHSDARLSASWKVPWLAAAHLVGQRRAAGRRQARADDAAAAEAVLRIEQVHVAALAAAEPGDLAEDLGGHAIERHALGDGEVVRPVGADHGVLRSQVRADADGDRLLAGREVHLAGHRARGDVEGQPRLDVRRQLAFQIDLRQRLLVAADQQHRLVHPQQAFGRGFHARAPVGCGSPQSRKPRAARVDLAQAGGGRGGALDLDQRAAHADP
jgi:hypothetical protein